MQGEIYTLIVKNVLLEEVQGGRKITLKNIRK